MVFLSHPQTGWCRAADWCEATLTSGNGQSVRQNRMNETGARQIGAPAAFVRFANLVRHSKSREGKSGDFTGHIAARDYPQLSRNGAASLAIRFYG
jgi:hypothetical protein